MLQWRDLTVPEKLKVFKEINIPELYPAGPQLVNVQKIWSGFLEICNTLRSSTPLSAEEIESRVRSWLELFSIYQCKMLHHTCICWYVIFFTSVVHFHVSLRKGLKN